MPRFFDRCCARATFAVLVVATIAWPLDDAFAHGIAGSAHDKSVPEFVWLGAMHMAAGWDHLLFITGVVLLAGRLHTAAKLITAFVVGHSVTLLIATLAGWRFDATFVDVVIASSLVYVGVRGIRGRPKDWRAMGAIVFAFGLIHGLGLSTRLQDVGLPADGLLARVIAFNVGVELGQLWALTMIVLAGTLVVSLSRDPRVLWRPAFGALLAVGSVAAVVLAVSAVRSENPATSGLTAADAAVATRADCEQTQTNPATSAVGGAHPPKAFFGPNETAPERDFAHIIGDGYVVIRYRADIPTQERKQLSGWIEGGKGEGGVVGVVAAADAEMSEAVRATTARRALSCKAFDLRALQAFSHRWFADVQVQQAP
jgi:hydrogenase/urease accessory protein HupE